MIRNRIMLRDKHTEERAIMRKLYTTVSNVEIKLHGNHMIHTFSAAFLNFFAALEGRKE